MARTLKTLIDLFRKPDVAVADLEAAKAEARQLAAVAEAEADEAERRYEEGLLGPETQLAKLDEARRAAGIQRDRARKLATELDDRLAEAVQAEYRRKLAAAHQAAAAKCATIEKRLALEYPKAAGTIRSLLHDLAEAKLAREAANAGAEALGLDYIPDPEDVARGLAGVPEEIVKTELVELWVAVGRADPLPDDAQKRVTRNSARPKMGALLASNGAIDCSLKLFQRVVFREAVAPSDLGSLLHVVDLPELRTYAGSFVSASIYRGLEGAVAHLAGPAADAPPVQRAERVRFEPVDDLPTSRAAA